MADDASDAGRLTLDGFDIGDMGLHTLRRRLARDPQDPAGRTSWLGRLFGRRVRQPDAVAKLSRGDRVVMVDGAPLAQLAKTRGAAAEQPVAAPRVTAPLGRCLSAATASSPPTTTLAATRLAQTPYKIALVFANGSSNVLSSKFSRCARFFSSPGLNWMEENNGHRP